MNDADKSNHDELAHIPIETLGLSENAMRALKRVGITSVEECIYALEVWNNSGPGALPRGSAQAIEELIPKLTGLGYWPTSE